MSTLSTHSEVKSPSDALDTAEVGLKPTPHVTVRGRKSAALRKRTAHPIPQSLTSEGYLPRKRIRSNTVAVHLN